MKANRQNIIVLIVAVAFVFALIYVNQPGRRWVETYSSLDKEPYGGYVLHELMEDLFPAQEIRSEYRTLYELIGDGEDVPDLGSLLIVAARPYLESADAKALSAYLKSGKTVLIAANYFWSVTSDSIGLPRNFRMENSVPFTGEDALSEERFVDLEFKISGFPQRKFSLPEEAASQSFVDDSSPQIELPADSSARSTEKDTFKTLAINEFGKDVLRHYKVGDGNLYISTTPLLLSNYHLLDENSRDFSAGILSVLPADRPVTHIEYYQVGRLESQTPLRFVLANVQLKWAVWTMLGALLLFILFEAKRRQRAIPIIEPLQNKSLEFVQTLGRLYYFSKNDHTNLARKRVQFFKEYVRRHYYLETSELDAAFAQRLARKSGIMPKRVKLLVEIAQRAEEERISEKDFLKMEKLLGYFYQK